MSFDYKKYLASREWALKREAVRKRSGNKCERCGLNPQEAVHHLTYTNVGNEPLEDLQAVCNPCHEFLSGKSDIDPKPYKYPAEEAAEEWEAYVAGHPLCPWCSKPDCKQPHVDNDYSVCFDGPCTHCERVCVLVRINKTGTIFCDNCGKDVDLCAPSPLANS